MNGRDAYLTGPRSAWEEQEPPKLPYELLDTLKHRGEVLVPIVE